MNLWQAVAVMCRDWRGVAWILSGGNRQGHSSQFPSEDLRYFPGIPAQQSLRNNQPSNLLDYLPNRCKSNNIEAFAYCRSVAIPFESLLIAKNPTSLVSHRSSRLSPTLNSISIVVVATIQCVRKAWINESPKRDVTGRWGSNPLRVEQICL